MVAYLNVSDLLNLSPTVSFHDLYLPNLAVPDLVRPSLQCAFNITPFIRVLATLPALIQEG